MTTAAYTTNPGAPLYTAPTMRLFCAGPGGGNERPLSRWKPSQLCWRANGDISTLGIECVLGRGVGQSRLRPEQAGAAENVGAGDRIRLVDTATNREWFRGHVGSEELLVQSQQDEESYSWVVYGPELLLAHKAVQGQWCKSEAADDLDIALSITVATAVRSSLWQSHLPCIFNPQGEPNASNTVAWKLDSDVAHFAPGALNSGRVFEAPGRETKDSQGTLAIIAQPWNAYTALRSVVEWVDRYDVIRYHAADWAAIMSALRPGVAGAFPAIAEVNIDRMSLLEAMGAILLPIGYGFALEPWADASGKHRLIVYSLALPTASSRPNLAALSGGANVGVTSAAGKRAVVQRLAFSRDSHNVVNELIVLGDYKRVQLDLDFGGAGGINAWELKPFWDTAAHDLSQWYNAGGRLANPNASGAKAAPTVGGDKFSDRYDTTGYNWRLYQHVYRSFVWNEDGSANQFGWSIPDLVSYGLGDATTALTGMRRPRPMGETLTFDNNQFIPATVSMAVVDTAGSIMTDTWIHVSTIPFRDRCGFTFRRPLISKGDGATAGWAPWSAVEQLAKKTLPVAAGGCTTYGALVYLELLHNTIQDTGDTYRLVLRLSGTVEADVVVKGVGVGAGAVGPRWPLPSQRVVRVDERFQYKVRTDAHLWGAKSADTADERGDAQVYADKLMTSFGAELGHGSIVLRNLSRAYSIGDAIPSTSGRAIRFDLDAGGCRFPLVTSITWTLGDNANKTELVLDTPLLAIT